MTSLVAFNSYLLLLVAQDMVNYGEDDDGKEQDEDEHGRPCLPPTIFLPGVLFNIRALSQKQCIQQFRFTPRQIMELSTLLDLPYVVKTGKGNAALAVEALCITLYRLSFPTTLNDMQLTFHCNPSAISQLIWVTITFLAMQWSCILMWDENCLTRDRLVEFAGSVAMQGGHPSVFGFLDGTVHKICQPSFGQQSMYNGHK